MQYLLKDRLPYWVTREPSSYKY